MKILPLLILVSFVVSAVADYNVRDYGALGDNSHDDTDAIQTAIDAADNAGGETVFFPKGNYRTSDLIIGSGNTLSNHRTSHVYLEGAAHHAAVLKYGGAGTAIRFNMVIGGGMRRLDIVNNTGIRANTIGVETSGPLNGNGTQTHDCIFEEVTINGFHYGWKTSNFDGTSTSSEITAINLTLNSCDIGFLNWQYNGLNFVFTQLQMAGNGTGLDAETAGVHVFGGSASSNGTDFKFGNNGGANGIYDFRSEGAGTFISSAVYNLTVSGVMCQGASSGVAIAMRNTVTILGSLIKGDVSLDASASLTALNSTIGQTALVVSGPVNGEGTYDIRGCMFYGGGVYTRIPYRTGAIKGNVMTDAIAIKGAVYPTYKSSNLIDGSLLQVPSLPKNDPHLQGQMWNNNGAVMISGG